MLNPNTPVIYKNEHYIIVMSNPTYAIIEHKETGESKQVRVSEIRKV